MCLILQFVYTNKNDCDLNEFHQKFDKQLTSKMIHNYLSVYQVGKLVSEERP